MKAASPGTSPGTASRTTKAAAHSVSRATSVYTIRRSHDGPGGSAAPRAAGPASVVGIGPLRLRGASSSRTLSLPAPLPSSPPPPFSPPVSLSSPSSPISARRVYSLGGGPPRGVSLMAKDDAAVSRRPEDGTIAPSARSLVHPHRPSASTHSLSGGAFISRASLASSGKPSTSFRRFCELDGGGRLMRNTTLPGRSPFVLDTVAPARLSEATGITPGSSQADLFV
mmetsp:Transcript_48757/g.157551  ORF Transcript_48757/g.157551 Transcript_48757/m.157551 type:complete len:226 (-) Transcript_48757:143-820(-)